MELPCKFLSDKSTGSTFCPNEVTLGGLLGHQQDEAMIRNLECSAPPPSSREGRGAGGGVNNWPGL